MISGRSRRSPNYPSIDLGAAIDAMRLVFHSQRRLTMSRLELAQLLGRSGLKGRDHENVAAVRAYGLVDVTGADMRVGEDTITILEAPRKSDARAIALTRRAFHSSVFRRIALQYGDSIPDEIGLRHWLIDKKFLPRAAERLASNYLVTIELVGDEGGGFHLLEKNEEMESLALDRFNRSLENATRLFPPASNHRREIISLTEGDVTITFPNSLSIESYEDLAAFLKLFLRKARRRATAIGSFD